jgi:hypothetical protein
MGLRPTHGDESAFLRPIGSKRVMRDFRRSVMALYEKVIKVKADVPGVTHVRYPDVYRGCVGGQQEAD